jgi:hypothetical protein
MDVERANGFTQWLANVLDYGHDQTDEEEKLWQQLDVGRPIVNNLIVTLPSGKQYKIHVRPLERE